MNEDQARTILNRVQAEWQLPMDEIVEATPDQRAEELEEFPIDGVSAFDLERAILRRERDPRWAE